MNTHTHTGNDLCPSLLVSSVNTWTLKAKAAAFGTKSYIHRQDSFEDVLPEVFLKRQGEFHSQSAL